jgi:hypothetical protein
MSEIVVGLASLILVGVVLIVVEVGNYDGRKSA